MNKTVSYLTTKEAAEKLEVHVRTARKWIETFEEYIGPKLNSNGHYILSAEGITKLLDIKQRMQKNHATLKKVREELILEGKIYVPGIKNIVNPNPGPSMDHKLTEFIGKVDELADEITERVERVEDNIYNLFDFIEDMEEKLISITQKNASSGELKSMFNEIRNKQDQLRIELRSVNFTHKLTANASDKLLPRRTKRTRFLGIF